MAAPAASTELRDQPPADASWIGLHRDRAAPWGSAAPGRRTRRRPAPSPRPASRRPRIDALMQHDRCPLHLQRRGDDLEHVVHARGLAEVDAHRAHHEGKARRLLLGLLEQRALVGAEQAQIVGAAALHEAQIARVIDDAGKIGVLVIDPHRLEMPAVADFAVERGCVHRQFFSATRHVLLPSPPPSCGRRSAWA